MTDKSKLQTQINSYRDENENLKKQYFGLDKKLHSEESKYEDEIDKLSGFYQLEHKKYLEAKSELKSCYKDLNNYKVILDRLEVTVQDLQSRQE